MVSGQYRRSCRATVASVGNTTLGIENGNHHVRDVILQEDASRIRKNPFNLSVLRSIALNILRINKVDNIKGEFYENSDEFFYRFNKRNFGNNRFTT